MCHTRPAGLVLGGRTRQWNLDVAVPGRGPTNQLVLASERGLFDATIAPGQTASWARLVPLEETSARLEARVRSYLDANCAHCHRPGGLSQVGIDARYDTPLDRQGLIRGRLRWPPIPEQGEAIVTPKDLARSRLFTIVAERQMPPLGTVLPHAQAADVIREWIESLDGPPALDRVTIAWSRSGRGQPAKVVLAAPDPAATVYYTTDGSHPSPETSRYTGPFDLEGAGVIQAVAVREGFTPSRRAEAKIPDLKTRSKP
jgi:mono/diheme cytochrome c family protein